MSTYSCMFAGRHTGSATEMRKSYAALYTGEKLSRKMRPSLHIHSGRFAWSGFSVKCE